jgi:hypothetical protein
MPTQIGDRVFLELPGDKKFELPPLLVHDGGHPPRKDHLLSQALGIVGKDDLVPTTSLDLVAGTDAVERRKFDFALNVVERHLAVVRAWHWGDAIQTWMVNCEEVFARTPVLKSALAPDIWPHAGRSSFVRLLADKKVRPEAELLEAVGLRLAFRQPLPIHCVSENFLFFLGQTLSATAFRSWETMSPPPHADLPPERFAFQVVVL